MELEGSLPCLNVVYLHDFYLFCLFVFVPRFIVLLKNKFNASLDSGRSKVNKYATLMM